MKYVRVQTVSGWLFLTLVSLQIGLVGLLYIVTINDISVLYVMAHRYARGLKKKVDLRSGYVCHGDFEGFFKVTVQHRHRVILSVPKTWTMRFELTT